MTVASEFDGLKRDRAVGQLCEDLIDTGICDAAAWNLNKIVAFGLVVAEFSIFIASQRDSLPVSDTMRGLDPCDGNIGE